MEAHQTAIVEIPEQSDRTESSGYQVRTGPMLGFKNFDYAAFTIAEVELLHRICKGQSALYRLPQFTDWDYIAPGRTLRTHLKESGAIDAGFMLAVTERVLHVLHACEAQGIIRHGDLHSGNILIGDSSRAKLDDSLQPRVYVADFGYGMAGGTRPPKDDYRGLAQIYVETREIRWACSFHISPLGKLNRSNESERISQL